MVMTEIYSTQTDNCAYCPFKISANGIDTEIDPEILNILGVDPNFMKIDIHRSTQEELNFFS